jgi:hypothetical protein
MLHVRSLTVLNKRLSISHHFKAQIKVVTDPSPDRGSLPLVALRTEPSAINGSNIKLAVGYTGADCAATNFDKPAWQDTPKLFPRPQG